MFQKVLVTVSQLFLVGFLSSMLGPLLFMVYINDLCKVSELILFAGDTNIVCSQTDASYLMEVNLELKKISLVLYK